MYDLDCNDSIGVRRRRMCSTKTVSHAMCHRLVVALGKYTRQGPHSGCEPLRECMRCLDAFTLLTKNMHLDQETQPAAPANVRAATTTWGSVVPENAVTGRCLPGVEPYLRRKYIVQFCCTKTTRSQSPCPPPECQTLLDFALFE